MFYLYNIATSYVAIMLAAAIIPAVVLLVYVYKKDKAEKEPLHIIFELIIRGIFAALLAMFLESIAEWVLPRFVDPKDPYYFVFFAFLGVAAIEEGCKLFFLYRRTWYDPNFNYSFDGIVYAVTVSLGFAAFENIGYVFQYGLGNAAVRALTAIPGHMSFAVFMGYFYGRARKEFDRRRTVILSKILLFMSYIVSVLLHGFYDSCAMAGTDDAMKIFLAFIVVMFIVAFAMIRHESKYDRPV